MRKRENRNVYGQAQKIWAKQENAKILIKVQSSLRKRENSKVFGQNARSSKIVGKARDEQKILSKRKAF